MQDYPVNEIEQVRLVSVINTPFRVLSLGVLFVFVVIIWINAD